MTATCTIGPSAVTGKRCGKPAVYSFTSSDGETFHECADHYAGPVEDYGRIGEPKVGDKVVIGRGDHDYVGTVVKVGARGAVYAEFTYKNGATRVVRV